MVLPDYAGSSSPQRAHAPEWTHPYSQMHRRSPSRNNSHYYHNQMTEIAKASKHHTFASARVFGVFGYLTYHRRPHTRSEVRRLT
ncbi:hypothetical protein SCLCIDRAFT_296808 [Scleroderma citrinum Foug A]|uniref:Uncharacterized protein n=1 Tax=Scleroderma citrinum Foug A TaxID=1036808 RepID=A0A0C2ZS39_9AGAM|nr:hypothetical protein SCLCIDRAFT_296808 [Scleroderma citrinum Foug A]